MENVHLNGIQQALTKNLSDKLVEVVFTWSAFNLRPGKLGRPESNRSLVLGMDVNLNSIQKGIKNSLTKVVKVFSSTTKLQSRMEPSGIEPEPSLCKKM